MAPRKSKSLFRGPDVQHFQLVHRSQRDPLIHDPDASQQVFKAVGRANEKGKTLAELETEFTGPGGSGPSASRQRVPSLRENEGEAAEHGIFYDDTSYDYMQHLRPVGDKGFEAVLLAAPTRGSSAAGKYQTAGKGKFRDPSGPEEDEDVASMFLPPEVLPSAQQLTREQAYDAQSAIPRELQGLQPDMNPHLRQTLEALEDDAFVAGGGQGADEEDWFDELIKGGARDDEESDPEWEFKEWGDENDNQRVGTGPSSGPSREPIPAGEESWEDRFRAFKQSESSKAIKEDTASTYDDEDEELYRSEMGDTIGSLPAMSVIGGKKRRKKTGSDASGYSMSSSSMFRNKGLSTLDEMFDKVEQDYDRNSDDEDELDDFPEDEEGELDDNASMFSAASTSTLVRAMRSALDEKPPELSREDFENIMDDFLDNYEVVGRRMVPSMSGETGADKLSVVRNALLEDEEEPDTVGGFSADYIRKRFLRDDLPEEVEQEIVELPTSNPNNRWDVETILSTRTNTENHPKLISVPSRKTQKAKAPVVREEVPEDSESESGSETETEETIRRSTVARSKNESKEEKKARKQAVKAERAARRVEKKSRQEAFHDERRRQLSSHSKLVGGGGAADVTVVAQRKMGVLSLS